MSIKVCFFLLFLGQCLFAQETHSTDTYSISYPSEWELDKSGMMGTDFMLFSALEGSSDNFRENVNLVKEDVSMRNIDLKTYVESSKEMITNMITDAQIISLEEMDSYYRMNFTGRQGIYDLKFMQHIYMKEGMAYVLTFTAKAGDYDNYAAEAEKFMLTFKL